jgi:hypothetical protein
VTWLATEGRRSVPPVEPERRLRRLPPAVRADLLRVLESPSGIRADVVRQFHERGDDGMVEMLAELEADELLRERVILMLRKLT